MKRLLFLAIVCTVTVVKPILEKHKGAHSYKKQDFAGAQSHFDAIIAKHPTDVAALYNAGKAAAAQQNFTQAQAYLQEATGNISDATPQLLQKQIAFDYGNSLARTADYQKALEQYKKVLALDKDDAYAPKMIEQIEKLLKQQQQQEQQSDEQQEKKQDQKKEEQQQKNKDQKNQQSGDGKKEQQSGQQEKNDQQQDGNQSDSKDGSNNSDQSGQQQKDQRDGNGQQDQPSTPQKEKDSGADKQQQDDLAQQEGQQQRNDTAKDDQRKQDQRDLDRQSGDNMSDDAKGDQKAEQRDNTAHKNPSQQEQATPLQEPPSNMPQLDGQSQRLLDLVAAQEGKALKQLLKVQVKEDEKHERRQYQQDHNW